MKKLGILVMPLMAISLLASCNKGGGDKPTPEECTLSIALDNCKTEEESTTYTKKYTKGATIDAINVTPTDDHVLTSDSVPSEYKQYWKESSTEGTWAFSSLTMDKNHEFTISATEGATLTLILNNCIVDGQSTYSKTYIKGATIDAITVTPTEPCFLKKSSISIDYKDYWKEGEKGSWILSNLVMNNNHTINIKGLHNYHASIGKCEHLSFTTIDDKPFDNVLITEDDDFTFKMKATVESNTEGYKLPTQLSIFVGDSTVELEPDCYDIEEITSQLEATVTIKGENVTGDIKISGKGVQEGYYAVDVSKCFGVNATIESVDPPYFYANQDGTVTFTQLDTYKLPADKNIIVKFDDNDWISPASASSSEWCTYDETTHKLTLKANKAKSNVMIGARSPKYQILEELEWKDISDYSTAGYAPYLFYVGDEKTVEVNGLDHKVRIIDFNHDNLVSGRKAGITFEFVNVITDSNGAVTTHWNSKDGDSSTNYDYRESTLNDFLNNNVLDMLPSGDEEHPDLRQVIKPADKKVGVYSSGSYVATSFDGGAHPYPYLFSLAYYEMDTSTPSDPVPTGEGTIYQYYGSLMIKEDRAKKPVGGTTEVEYWLRSPYANYNCNYLAWGCFTTGDLYYNYISKDDIYVHAVAPAFCI